MTLKEEARKVVENYLLISSGYAFVTSPIPGTTLGVMALETKMVYEIAKVYGYNLSPGELTGLVGSLLGAGQAIKTVLSQVLTFLPGFGYIAKAAIAGGSCGFLGESAIEYFESKYKTDSGFA